MLRWLGAALVVLLAMVAASAWVWRDYNEPGPLVANKIVVIPRGSGVGAVAETLAQNGVIRHPWLFVAGAAVDDRVGALKAGEYEFAAAITPRAAAALVASGRVVQHKITVPEGLTSAEIVALLARERARRQDFGAASRRQPPARHLLLCAGRSPPGAARAHAPRLRACVVAALDGT